MPSLVRHHVDLQGLTGLRECPSILQICEPPYWCSCLSPFEQAEQWENKQKAQVVTGCPWLHKELCLQRQQLVGPSVAAPSHEKEECHIPPTMGHLLIRDRRETASAWCTRDREEHALIYLPRPREARGRPIRDCFTIPAHTCRTAANNFMPFEL